MLRFSLAVSILLLLAATAGMVSAGHAHQRSPAQETRAGPASRLATIDLCKPYLTQIPRDTRPTPVALCRRGEKLCRIATYITWCCRADQQCDYSTIGGCR